MNALITERITMNVGALRPWAQNPRQILDDDPTIDELAASLAKHGQLVPLVVRRDADGDTAEVLGGNRRLAAMRRAGMLRAVVDVVRPDVDDVTIAIIENVERRQLSPLEEATAAERVLERLRGPRGRRKVTAELVAAELGRPVRWTQRRLQLLGLTPEVRARFNELTLEAAEVLATLPAPRQLETLEGAIAWRPLGPRDSGAPISASEIRRRAAVASLDLAAAPFALDVIYDGGARQTSCHGCQIRTGAQAELWPGEAAADRCLDPECYKAKAGAAYDLEAAAHPAAVVDDGGETIRNAYVSELVIGTDAAWRSGYGMLEDRATWAEVFERAGGFPKPSLLRDPVTGGPLWAYPRAAANEAFDRVAPKRGGDVDDPDADAKADAKAAERERIAEIGSRVEARFNRELFGGVGAAEPSRPTEDDHARASSLARARGGLLFAIEAVCAVGFGDGVLGRVLTCNPDLEGRPQDEWSVVELTAILRQVLVAQAMEQDFEITNLVEPGSFDEPATVLARRVLEEDGVDLRDVARSAVEGVAGATAVRRLYGLAGVVLDLARSEAGDLDDDGPDGGDPAFEDDD